MSLPEYLAGIAIICAFPAACIAVVRNILKLAAKVGAGVHAHPRGRPRSLSGASGAGSPREFVIARVDPDDRDAA